MKGITSSNTGIDTHLMLAHVSLQYHSMITSIPLDILWIFEISRPTGYQILFFLSIILSTCIYVKRRILVLGFSLKVSVAISQHDLMDTKRNMDRRAYNSHEIPSSMLSLNDHYICRSYITLFSITSTLALLHGFRPHTPKITLIYCNFVVVKHWNLCLNKSEGGLLPWILEKLPVHCWFLLWQSTPMHVTYWHPQHAARYSTWNSHFTTPTSSSGRMPSL